MGVASDNQRSLGRFAFWRRKEPWLVINGYHAGDIHSEEPVLIQPEATVVGNIFAPRVTVAGLLNGSLIAQKTTVQEKGQIWGDVYTISLEVLSGGRIQGWITTLDDDSYPQLQAEGTIPQPQLAHASTQNGDNLLDRSVRPPSVDQIFALRYLQTEAAAAMAARAELEQTFEKRLTEVAGESTAKVQSLHEELDASRASLNELRIQNAEAEETIRTRNNRIERQTKELSTTRSLLTEHNRELASLRQTSSSQQEDLASLQDVKKRLEQTVVMLQEQLEDAVNRAKNLEGALQNNLQHSAEQEESLFRWQELSEVTQKQMSELEKELERSKLQLAEASQVNEILREQREQLENEWQQALDELDQLRDAQLAEPSELPVEITELQEALATAETAVETSATQLLWQKTNTQALQQELDKARQLVLVHEEEVASLQATLFANQSQNDVERSKIQANVHKQQQAWEKQVRDMQEKLESERTHFQQLLEDATERLNTSEAAMDNYYQQVQTQGNELAESRVALVEKDIEIQAWQQKATEQANLVKTVKEQARDYIHGLKQKLTRAERQVHDLTQVLERIRGRKHD